MNCLHLTPILVGNSPTTARCCKGKKDKVALWCVKFWVAEIKSDTYSSSKESISICYFCCEEMKTWWNLNERRCFIQLTCVILAFLTRCWADWLDWLAEDQCWPLTLTSSSALGWSRSCPRYGPQAQTQTSARAQETTASSGLSCCTGLQRVLSTRFETGRSSHLEFKITKST